MLVQIRHTNGQTFVLPVAQVVVLNDSGHPVAAAFEAAGAITHANAADPDWLEVAAQLGLAKAARAEIVRL